MAPKVSHSSHLVILRMNEDYPLTFLFIFSSSSFCSRKATLSCFGFALLSRFRAAVCPTAKDQLFAFPQSTCWIEMPKGILLESGSWRWSPKKRDQWFSNGNSLKESPIVLTQPYEQRETHWGQHRGYSHQNQTKPCTHFGLSASRIVRTKFLSS